MPEAFATGHLCRQVRLTGFDSLVVFHSYEILLALSRTIGDILFHRKLPDSLFDKLPTLRPSMKAAVGSPIEKDGSV